MEFFPAVTTIAQTIQLSLAPVFLLTGIGAIINVLAGRLARVVDRARDLERLHPTATGTEHDRHIWELRLLDRRMTVINAALLLCVSSAIAVCSVVALLFIGELAGFRLGTIVALIFILAMLLLVAGLVMLLVEVRLSLRATHIRAELLGAQRGGAR
ncbi:DUF2721 domain-containing protein [Sphingomonas koreensis]|nr:DUF2721 domain-containing protein [Sphingomonas koreensis]